MPAPFINLGSDYAPLSEELWLFLHSIYGGGPLLTLRPPSVSGISQVVSSCDTSCHSTASPAIPVSSMSSSLTSGIASGISSSYSSQVTLCSTHIATSPSAPNKYVNESKTAGPFSTATTGNENLQSNLSPTSYEKGDRAWNT